MKAPQLQNCYQCGFQAHSMFIPLSLLIELLFLLFLLFILIAQARLCFHNDSLFRHTLVAAYMCICVMFFLCFFLDEGNTEDEGGIVDNDTIISKLRIKPGTGSRYSDFPKPSSAIRTGIDPFSSSSSSFGSHSSKAELQELYQRGRLSEVEQKLGYEFKDKSHLVQATTHLSYAYNTVTGCYQEYEFLGDAILDFLVTLHVYKGSRSLSPGQLTSIKSALVNNNVFSFHVIELGLHKFLAHSSPALTADLNEFIDMVTDNDSDGGEALYPSLYEVMM